MIGNYETPDGGWDMEREQADFDQAEMERAGRVYSRRAKASAGLRAAGNLEGAAELCPHGGGYPLASLAATGRNDPRAGEKGVRCLDCGSVLSNFPWEGPVDVWFPCEIAGA